MNPDTIHNILLVGNPNVGKSVIFKLLTGVYTVVSNYPGTTVEIARGNLSMEGLKFQVIDLPGVNSLTPTSEDEAITRDIIMKEPNRGVVLIMDSKNLLRGLLLALQLLEMEVPFIVVLNMWDEALSRGVNIDIKRLRALFGVEVIPTIAIQKKGISLLKRAIGEFRFSPLRFSYPEEVEGAIRELEVFLPDTGISKRSMALMLLCGDLTLFPFLKVKIGEEKVKEMERVKIDLAEGNNRDLAVEIRQCRIDRARGILKEVAREQSPLTSPFLERFSKLLTHPLGGVVLLVFILYIVYLFVGSFGAGTLVDLLEGGVFENYLNPFMRRAVGLIPVPDLIKRGLVGEFGVITMALTYSLAIILPVVTTFFIAFSILEDSGYLPRIALMINRFFKAIGLSGKAVFPFILGFGCDTMATLTTRILNSKKERLLATFLLALAIPCSAQLGVIMGILGEMGARAVIIWGFTILLTFLLAGFIASKIAPGRIEEFILEIPPLRLPLLSNIAIKTVARVEWYLREAVPLFILASFLLYLLDETGMLPLLERGASPFMEGILGLPEEATGAFLMGFLRRDYSATRFFEMAKAGRIDFDQTVVGLVTITLFIPCIANLLIIIKERGFRTGMAIFFTIIPISFGVGGIVRLILERF